MSNTLNTPIEALELEYPMRVERYELRDGSGGDGEHRGGDGVERAVRVLEPATLNLLTDRRRHSPEGREGGGDGAPGENLLNDEELPPKASRDLAEGDVVTVRTPGGGGYGSAAARSRGRSGSASRSRSGSRTSGVRQTASASSTAARASSWRSPTMAPKPPAESIARLIDSSSAYSYAKRSSKAASGMRPACTARSSSTPGCHSVDGSSRPAGGGGRKRASTAFISPRSKRSGRPQTWITIGAPGLATRPASRSAVDHVVGEEERAEAGDGVERVVGVGQALEVAEREVGVGHALAGDREQRLGGVDAGDDGAVVGGGAQEGAAAAAGVEHGLAGARGRRA